MAENRLRTNLQNLGLSSKEVDVYFTILDHGEAKVSQIVDDSTVSQRYVYELCEKLDERGFVILNDHIRPSTVQAQKPERAIEEINSHLDEIERDIENLLNSETISELDVELIKSGKTLAKRWRTYMAKANEEVFVCLPANQFDRFRSELAAAVDRNLNVLLLLTEPGLAEFDYSHLDNHANLARAWNSTPRPLLTVDNKVAIHDEPKLLLDETVDGSAISLTRSSITGNLFSTYISNYWQIAEEKYCCEPDDLPQTYPQLRNALVHATLHKRAGRELIATVRATDTTTNEMIEMNEVPVVEIRQGLLEPFTNEFPIENAIEVVFDDDVVSVGGIDAIIEDYEALDIMLDFTD